MPRYLDCQNLWLGQPRVVNIFDASKTVKSFDEAGGGLVGEGEERGEGVDAESNIYRPKLDVS